MGVAVIDLVPLQRSHQQVKKHSALPTHRDVLTVNLNARMDRACALKMQN